MGILLRSSADQPRSQNVSQCRATEHELLQVRCRCWLPTNLVFIMTAITQSDLDSVICATLFLFVVFLLLIFCTYLSVQTKLATHKFFNYYIMHFCIVYLIPYHNWQHQSTTEILSDIDNNSRTEAGSIHSVERCWQRVLVHPHISPARAEMFCRQISRRSTSRTATATAQQVNSTKESTGQIHDSTTNPRNWPL